MGTRINVIVDMYSEYFDYGRSNSCYVYLHVSLPFFLNMCEGTYSVIPFDIISTDLSDNNFVSRIFAFGSRTNFE